jgi:hypothetical protein
MRSDDASATMRDRLHSGKVTDQQARSPMQLFNARAVADVRVEIISAASAGRRGCRGIVRTRRSGPSLELTSAGLTSSQEPPHCCRRLRREQGCSP